MFKVGDFVLVEGKNIICRIRHKHSWYINEIDIQNIYVIEGLIDNKWFTYSGLYIEKQFKLLNKLAKILYE